MSSPSKKSPTELLSEVKTRLIEAGLAEDYLGAAAAIGVSREWTRRFLDGQSMGKLYRPVRKKLENYIEGRPAPGRDPKPVRQAKFDFEASVETKAVKEAPPAPTFVEHVLFTAGRIAELANQIAHAAEKQLEASKDLGRRSTEQLARRAPVAHHAPAKAPTGEGKRPKPRGEA